MAIYFGYFCWQMVGCIAKIGSPQQKLSLTKMTPKSAQAKSHVFSCRTNIYYYRNRMCSFFKNIVKCNVIGALSRVNHSFGALIQKGEVNWPLCPMLLYVQLSRVSILPTYSPSSYIQRGWGLPPSPGQGYSATCR